MQRIGIPMDGERAQELGSDLQCLLVDLIALSLAGKQAHWHVTGRHFVPVHEQLDAIVDSTREYADQIAERSVQLGQPVDGRAGTVAAEQRIGEMPDGFLDGEKAVRLIADGLEALIARARERLDRIGELDPVTQDLVIEVLTGLEKHLWMLQAQLV
ncbi:MAG: Dps family protein [Acidimicrobiales bacterium]